MSKETFLPTYKGCLVCGEPEINPSTLNRRFKMTDKGVQVSFQADERQAGYKGVVHGGIITALLDETIGWSVAVERKKLFVTGEITVRFVRPLPVGLPVTVYGRPVEHKSRYSIAEGEIVDSEGVVYAKASGKFFLMRDQDSIQISQYLTYRDNDVQIFNES